VNRNRRSEVEDLLCGIGDQLKEAVSRFLVPLQTTRLIKEDAFRELHESALRLVYACRNREEVPKSLLRELQVSYLVLRSEAPHFGDKKSLLEGMADKIELCFSLILRDEIPEDRRPGVPRII
jgi:hypothetical protein